MFKFEMLHPGVYNLCCIVHIELNDLFWPLFLHNYCLAIMHKKVCTCIAQKCT